jgi:hypothetical protein
LPLGRRLFARVEPPNAPLVMEAARESIGFLADASSVGGIRAGPLKKEEQGLAETAALSLALRERDAGGGLALDRVVGWRGSSPSAARPCAPRGPDEIAALASQALAEAGGAIELSEPRRPAFIAQRDDGLRPGRPRPWSFPTNLRGATSLNTELE